ncbi:Hypothetical_protein [Hexamita inflata]|uniref:Hypothetical_protein n=1 Tax=Hexamita inflata TaxID=28002 RepID=A0AA86RAJ7_9EUKA|nr:Hypothetical protein HINF_LOCUS58723 [Hexamita inflata]
MNLQPSQDYKSLWDVNYNGQQLTNTSDSTHVYLKKKGKKQNFSINQSNSSAYCNLCNSGVYSGAIMGYLGKNSQILVNLVVLQQIYISGGSYSKWHAHNGGVVGQICTNAIIVINNTIFNSSSVISIQENQNYAHIGGFVGKNYGIVTINSSQILQGNIYGTCQSAAFSGGIVGYMDMNSSLCVMFSLHNSTNISAKSNYNSSSAGFIGNTNATIYSIEICNSRIVNSIIISNGLIVNAKISLNYISGPISFLNSSVEGINVINDVVIINCNIISIDSIDGC